MPDGRIARSHLLLGQPNHIVDCRFHFGIGQGGIAALGGHGVLAVKCAGVERILASLDARRPGSFVAGLGRASYPTAVAGDAGRLVYFFAIRA